MERRGIPSSYIPHIVPVISREFVAGSADYVRESSCFGSRISEAVSCSQRANSE